MTAKFARFLCGVAGVREDALARAPKAHGQSATIGFLLLLTSLLASLTSGYAVRRAFAGDAFAGPIALMAGSIWGGIVFCLDRGLLLGLDKFAPNWKLAIQAAVRASLAIALGLTISKPLALRVCRSVLDTEIRRERRQAIAAEAVENSQLEHLEEIRGNVAQLGQFEHSQQERLRGEPDSYAYRSALEEFHAAGSRYRRISGTNQNRIERAQREMSAMEGENSPSSKMGRDALREAVWRWRQEISEAGGVVASARAQLDKARADWLATETKNLHELHGRLESANQRAAQATERVGARDAESETALAKLVRNDLVFEYTTMARIESNRANPYSASITSVAWGLDAIFILLELCPMLIKIFSPKGALDHATRAIEFEDQERINSDANATAVRLQKQAEAALAVATAALEKWRDAECTHLETLTVAQLEQLNNGSWQHGTPIAMLTKVEAHNGQQGGNHHA